MHGVLIIGSIDTNVSPEKTVGMPLLSSRMPPSPSRVSIGTSEFGISIITVNIRILQMLVKLLQWTQISLLHPCMHERINLPIIKKSLQCTW